MMKVNFRVRVIGVSLADVLKVFLGMSFGFSISSLYNVCEPETSKCKKCDCAREKPNHLFQSDFPMHLQHLYKPQAPKDVILYEYFNGSTTMNICDDEPRTELLGHQINDIKNTVNQVISFYNSGKKDRWVLDHIINGYRRLDPSRGMEYQLHLLLSARSNNQLNACYTTQFFEALRPFAETRILSQKAMKNQEKGNLVLPLSASLDGFKEFLQNYEKECLLPQENVSLTVVMFDGATLNESRHAYMTVRTQIDSLLTKYPSSDIRLLQGHGEFSRAEGIRQATSQLHEESLMMFCDVAVKFSMDSITRCRLNAVQTKQVYYPIVFSQYHPDIIRNYSPANKVSHMNEINKYTGLWLHEDYAVACMYNTDYQAVGGFNSHLPRWKQDMDLYQKLVLSNMQVFRAVDPGLIQPYHLTSCSASLTEEERRLCVEAVVNGLGSRQQLGRLYSSIKIQ